ncbi:ATPase involved in replication control Cdc46/Mcm family-like protein [Halobiforma lacisalsi AJ5]|uniref:ATPase involved in replication control Cdc46/Mcm family-like protein n=1 Tax=Natronobacterium lacisalsi AJ5 TaxID=358396 RepID=M0LEH5_NATLA|nr:ATPase involved in replication control Cdc46/Mcm family-like protein [Halobiforma lacisalsi AJ5]
MSIVGVNVRIYNLPDRQTARVGKY